MFIVAQILGHIAQELRRHGVPPAEAERRAQLSPLVPGAKVEQFRAGAASAVGGQAVPPALVRRVSDFSGRGGGRGEKMATYDAAILRRSFRRRFDVVEELLRMPASPDDILDKTGTKGQIKTSNS